MMNSRLFVVAALALALQSPVFAYSFSTNLMTEVASNSDKSMSLKVTQQDDAIEGAFPVGTVFSVSKLKNIDGQFLADDKIQCEITKASLPNGQVVKLNKSLTLKPRSIFERISFLVWGLKPNQLKLDKGTSIIVFDTASDADNSLTAITDPTLSTF